jgi:isoquinoline 1-oxidoreductase beta subunit
VGRAGRRDPGEGRRGNARERQKATFGELAAAAAKQPVPTTVKLKDAKDFVSRRTSRAPIRAPSRTARRATRRCEDADLLTAVVAYPPRFWRQGQELRRQSVNGIPGVRYVIEVPTAWRWSRRISRRKRAVMR